MTDMASTTLIALFLLTYLLLVRILRYHRCDRTSRTYGGTSGRPLSSMTLSEAHDIQNCLNTVEFPFTFYTSAFFAIFKTYGVPSISGLLAATRELADTTTASKRAADTSILMTEVMLNPRDSERTIDAIARINFLHDRYRKAGKISDDDMLYTLSLFALEPGRWVVRYEWRSLTDVEECAIGIFWRDMGQAMEIPFDKLGVDADTVDGLTWLHSLDAWSKEYEKKSMRPASSNEKVARTTLDVVLFNVPVRLRSFSRGVVSALLEPRPRTAMRLPEPGRAHRLLLETVFTVRKLVLRHLCLPRPVWLRSRWFTDAPDPRTGNFHFLLYIDRPWYVKPTVNGRWGLVAMCLRMLRGVLPGDDDMYHPEGYRIPDLGPASMKGKGAEDMERTRSMLRGRRLGSGCPMPYRRDNAR